MKFAIMINEPEGRLRYSGGCQGYWQQLWLDVVNMVLKDGEDVL